MHSTALMAEFDYSAEAKRKPPFARLTARLESRSSTCVSCIESVIPSLFLSNATRLLTGINLVIQLGGAPTHRFHAHLRSACAHSNARSRPMQNETIGLDTTAPTRLLLMPPNENAIDPSKATATQAEGGIAA